MEGATTEGSPWKKGLADFDWISELVLLIDKLQFSHEIGWKGYEKACLTNDHFINSYWCFFWHICVSYWWPYSIDKNGFLWWKCKKRGSDDSDRKKLALFIVSKLIW